MYSSQCTKQITKKPVWSDSKPLSLLCKKCSWFRFTTSETKKWKYHSFLKSMKLTALTPLNETWLKSNFKCDIPNYNITCNDRPTRLGVVVGTFVHNNINLGIAETFSSINTANEAFTVIPKESQILISISTVYIAPKSLINTFLLSNIKNFVGNVIINKRS